jgi:hypothetical protein
MESNCLYVCVLCESRRNSECALHFTVQVLNLLNNYARFLKSHQLTTRATHVGTMCWQAGPHVAQPYDIWSCHTRDCEDYCLGRHNKMHSGRSVPEFQRGHLNLYQSTCCHVPEDRELRDRPFFTTWRQTSVIAHAMKACLGFEV